MRTKLLVAFVGIVSLFVVVGVLGLLALGQSNARVERLGTLQLRAAVYQSVQTQANQLRQLLGLRVAGDPNVTTYLGGNASAAPGGRSWTLVDRAIEAALSQLGPATNESRFGFVPPARDEALLRRIRLDHRRFTRALGGVLALDAAGGRGYKTHPFLTQAIDADNDLFALRTSWRRGRGRRPTHSSARTGARTSRLATSSSALASARSSSRCCSVSCSPGP